ncbi:MAG: tubulin-like doman-containing protein [Clostridia bacterium]
MPYYLIGIGGTGQRVVNAFIHSCYMNAICDGECKPLAEVRVLIVDKDNNSGNASSTLLERYNMEREIKPTSKTELKYFGAWEPKPADASDLSALARGEESQKLMRVLYDDYERTALSEKTGMGGGFIDGFKGHPNVGATYQDVALQDGLGSKKTETAIGNFFSEIEHDIKNDEPKTKVFIVASLFGGTGASGLPLLVQRLRRIKNDSNSSKLLLGTLMMLPYFTYKRPKNVDRIFRRRPRCSFTTKMAIWIPPSPST